jgi:UDPglucose 6-dehydrogenase
VFANVLAEFCESTGADVDEVTSALALGHQRIVSPAYMTAGMGDGGACHPRDNIALSALANQHGTSVNLMGFLIAAREMQTAWHVSTITHWLEMTGFPLVVLGKTYKPGVESTAGSPALLLAELLEQQEIKFAHVDHLVDGVESIAEIVHYDRRCVFFIATQHDVYADLDYPDGSVVIDPFGYVRSNDRITLVTPGRKRNA